MTGAPVSPKSTVSAGADANKVLRRKVLESLAEQGFTIVDGRHIEPPADDKLVLRELHKEAVLAQVRRAESGLKRYDRQFVLRLARGDEIDPAAIRPRLELIAAGVSDSARLWRWCSLHWSVPVSGGYGRRLRFIVRDAAHNNATIGIIGLADPVFALTARDQAIGWSAQDRATRLTNVMDAFVLGAAQPYSDLLGGKLLASLLQSDEVRDAFAERYGHRTSLISKRDPDAKLAMVTTSSALGRSSIYNRVLRRDGKLAMEPVGYTKGSGDFHFSGDIYAELAALAAASTPDGVTHRHSEWGSGFRNRREVVQRALRALDLNYSRLRVHGVQRQVFITRLAANADAFLRGEDASPVWQSMPAEDISEWWRERWAVPRATATSRWRDFDPDSWHLYE